MTGLIKFLYLAVILRNGNFDGPRALVIACQERLEQLDGLCDGGLLSDVHLECTLRINRQKIFNYLENMDGLIKLRD